MNRAATVERPESGDVLVEAIVVSAEPAATFEVNSSHLTLLKAGWPPLVCSLLQVGRYSSAAPQAAGSPTSVLHQAPGMTPTQPTAPRTNIRDNEAFMHPPSLDQPIAAWRCARQRRARTKNSDARARRSARRSGVGRFETDDTRFERRSAGAEISEEQQLGGRRSEDEDLVRVLQGAGELSEETVTRRRGDCASGSARPADAGGRGASAMHGRFVEALRANVKDARLLTVHPHRHLLPHEQSLAPIDKERPQSASSGGNPYAGRYSPAEANASSAPTLVGGARHVDEWRLFTRVPPLRRE